MKAPEKKNKMDMSIKAGESVLEELANQYNAGLDAYALFVKEALPGKEEIRAIIKKHSQEELAALLGENSKMETIAFDTSETLATAIDQLYRKALGL